MKEKNVIFVMAILIIAVILIAMFGLPVYRVWQKEKRGEANLREAEWSKKIAIEEAKAIKESAKYRAEAEVERAKGVAEANKIIGASLRENEQYLRYLWILGLQDGNSEVIYVPTEANLPLLEATRGLQK
ncbi:MAG: hypothetical protein KAT43_03425 [Nanoarchaeota archaeon]|nr:hypothetical protein [Nanoarchaeota archaeon]